MDTLLQPPGSAGNVPPDRGVVKTHAGQRVTAANDQEAFTHDLHVLLRHRLVLQPNGFECVVVVEEVLGPRYLAVPHREDPGDTRVHLDSARRAHSTPVTAPQYTVAAEVEHLGG